MICGLQKKSFHKLVFSFFFICLTLFIVSSTVLACTCKRGRTPVDEFKSSYEVFLGEVTDVRVVEDQNSWFDDFPDDGSFFIGSSFFLHEMKVEKSWKGVHEKTIRIGTWEDGAACGMGYWKIGHRLLIYSGKQFEPQGFWEKLKSIFKKPIYFVSLCGRKKSGKAIIEEVRILDSILEENSK